MMNDLRSRVQTTARRGALAVGLGAVVVAAACAPRGGPTPRSTTTVAPTTTEATTTTQDPKVTTTTEDPKTTTTVDPKTTTTTVDTTTTVPGSTTTVPASGTSIDVDELAPGMCVSPPDDKDSVAAVLSKDCDEAHEVEVFAVLEWSPGGGTADGFPGGAALRERAYELCQEPFAGYVGVPFWDSVFDITAITPAASTWGAGDRTIVCLIADVDGRPLTSSARDARR